MSRPIGCERLESRYLLSIQPVSMPPLGNQDSRLEATSNRVSTDGRYVVFESNASNLVPGDVPNTWDVFLRDMQTGVLTRLCPSGPDSTHPAITPDGHYVVFQSSSTSLVAGDLNHSVDVFRYDVLTGEFINVSVGVNGQADRNSGSASISDDGRFVVFESSATNLLASPTGETGNVFLRDLQIGETSLVSIAQSGLANGYSTSPQISGDGHYVAFTSLASNLTPDDANGALDVFVRKLREGVTTLVSSATNGLSGNGASTDGVISADGRYVAFASVASNLVAGDTNARSDVFLRDLFDATTVRVSVGSGGQANNDSRNPSISGNGRYVAFESNASNLTPVLESTSSDIFVRDTQQNATIRASVSSASLSTSQFPSISSDGLFVEFQSIAGDLVAGDTNNKIDIFLWRNDPPTAINQTVNVASDSSRQVTLTATDSPGTPVEYSLLTAPQHGTLSGLIPQLVYTPAPGYVGNDSFTFNASDGVSTGAAATVSLIVASHVPTTVASTTVPPSGVLPFASVSLGVTFSEAVVGGSLPANFQLKGAGVDGILGTLDDAALNVSVTMLANTSTIKFPALAAGKYRLTVRDAIVDSVFGQALDGDSDGQPTGDYVLDFAVVPKLAQIQWPDASFGDRGVVLVKVGGQPEPGRAMVLQPDGKIIVVGGGNDGTIDDFSFVRVNADGSLDSTFGTGGKVIVPIGTGHEQARAIALQADGRIVAAGYTQSSVTPSNYDFGMVRLNADGSIDSSFGSQGKVITDLGGSLDEIKGLAIQADGKIVAAGYKSNSVDQYQFAIARYNVDGSLDASFGAGGIVLTSVGGGNDEARAVAIQPDGKIVAVGHWYNGANYDFALARINTDGSLDGTFGNAGKVTTAFGVSNEYARAVVLQADGKIVATGYTRVTGSEDFALIRYNVDGTLDTTFGAGGKITTAIGSGVDTSYALAIQPDQKLVAVGISENASNRDFAVARYNTDGSLDSTFGDFGKLMSDIAGSHDEGYAVVVQPDGKLVVAGMSATSNGWNLSMQRYNLAPLPVHVTGQYVFFNNSSFDGLDPGASVADDGAIANDKTALLPGQTATFATYTSYSRGINGLIIDIAGLPGKSLARSDFLFRTGNEDVPRISTAQATDILVRAGAGLGGSDRVTITWPDGAIKNTWLEVTVLPSVATGLAEPYVFYFGNAVGESGDSAVNAIVNATDEIGARTHGKTFLDPAAIDNVYDFNRDRLVNATDQIIARSNAKTLATALKLITVPGSLAPLSSAAPLLRSDDENTTLHESIALGLAAPAPLRSKSAAMTASSETLATWQSLEAAMLDERVNPLPAIQTKADRCLGKCIADEQFITDDELFDLIGVGSRFPDHNR